jgi:gas vesicle protein
MRKKAAAAGGLLLVGAGYLAGILTAPKSGKETRKDIAKGANKARIDAEKKLKTLHSELKVLIKDAEARRKTLQDKAKKELDDAIEKAKVAKEKAREILSALHQGDADDPNLQAAIDEVKLAQKNLVTYLKKK